MCSVALVLTMRVWTMNRNVRKVLEHLHSRNHLRSQEFSTTDVVGLRRADAEAEKAMKRARILNEHVQHRRLTRRSLR